MSKRQAVVPVAGIQCVLEQLRRWLSRPVENTCWHFEPLRRSAATMTRATPLTPEDWADDALDDPLQPSHELPSKEPLPSPHPFQWFPLLSLPHQPFPHPEWGELLSFQLLLPPPPPAALAVGPEWAIAREGPTAMIASASRAPSRGSMR